MTDASLESRVDAIFFDALAKVRSLLDAEALRLFALEPGQYERFSRMAGAGPSICGPDGKELDETEMSQRAHDLLQEALRIHDHFGIDNIHVFADGTIIEDGKAVDLPPVAILIQGQDRDGEILLPVYVLGATDRADEGIVDHDLRVRPVELGKGEYTLVVNPDDLKTIAGEPFVYQREENAPGGP